MTSRASLMTALVFAKTPVEKRKIMRALKLTEISAVDRPAQEGALAVLAKNAGPTPEGLRQLERAYKALDARTDKALAKLQPPRRVDHMMVFEDAAAEAILNAGDAMRAEMDAEAPERAADRARREAGLARFLSRNSKLSDGGRSSEHDQPTDQQESDMTKDYEVDKDALAEAIAITKGCEMATAYKAIATAEKAGEEYVQALFTQDVQDALEDIARGGEGVPTAYKRLSKETGERAAEIRKSGDWRTKKASRQEALRERLYESPEEFGY